MSRLLIVEDDPIVSEALRDWLSCQRYVIDCVANGAEADLMLEQFQYDIIILDWELPEMSGVEVCSNFRNRGGRTPILMLTGKTQLDERVHGLDSGADDYIGKPFDLDELSARIRALLRRQEAAPNVSYKFLDLVVEPDTHKVFVDSNPIALTPNEFELLNQLIQKPGVHFSLHSIVTRFFMGESTTDSIRISLGSLRKKLETARSSATVETQRGLGYRLVPRPGFVAEV